MRGAYESTALFYTQVQMSAQIYFQSTIECLFKIKEQKWNSFFSIFLLLSLKY